jgi:hypothetical protein
VRPLKLEDICPNFFCIVGASYSILKLTISIQAIAKNNREDSLKSRTLLLNLLPGGQTGFGGSFWKASGQERSKREKHPTLKKQYGEPVDQRCRQAVRAYRRM